MAKSVEDEAGVVVAEEGRVVWTLVRRDSAIYGALFIIFVVSALKGAVPTD